MEEAISKLCDSFIDIFATRDKLRERVSSLSADTPHL